MGQNQALSRWQAYFCPDAGWTRCSFNGAELLKAGEAGSDIYLARSCPSTMDLAWGLLSRGGFPEMSWAAAVTQTRGRGQAGRDWQPFPGNLYATLRLPSGAGPDHLFPLALALILAQALAATGLPAEIKWPNDVLVSGQKVGGILVEERQGQFMAGFGVNVAGFPKSDGASIPAACLAGFGVNISTPALWKTLSTEIRTRFKNLTAHPHILAEELNRFLAFKNEWVVWETGRGKSEIVRIQAFEPDGTLRADSAHGERQIRSGRIFPRTGG